MLRGVTSSTKDSRHLQRTACYSTLHIYSRLSMAKDRKLLAGRAALHPSLLSTYTHTHTRYGTKKKRFNDVPIPRRLTSTRLFFSNFSIFIIIMHVMKNVICEGYHFGFFLNSVLLFSGVHLFFLSFFTVSSFLYLLYFTVYTSIHRDTVDVQQAIAKLYLLSIYV
ncbi:hypothetical protein DFH27DRAFT_510383 [Peziza echinospora]|nr:hypothetical protein DFH27DRAFT_510383 [Peziza echinospora]